MLHSGVPFLNWTAFFGTKNQKFCRRVKNVTLESRCKACKMTQRRKFCTVIKFFTTVILRIQNITLMFKDDSQPFMYSKKMSKKLFQYFVFHIFTISFGTFCVQIGQLFAAQWGSIPKSTTFSFNNSDFSISKHSSKTSCASNNWPIWAQKVPKDAQRCWLQTYVRVFF